MLTVATRGERLREARRRAMLSQEELAQESGVGVATIIRIERDQLKRDPHFSTLRKLAKRLDIEATELLED
ncbi:MAG: helix-turn-helix domain-containing protein [Actinomycetota bacterium]|nr:helix-turn-helix domain-containing protein [Actinomycetota bacterium]